MIPTLSILTPAVPSRIAQVDGLVKKLAAQIGELPVEHLVLLDNKRRTVGEKRDALLRIARGNYVAFVDDDDDVSNDYVQEILAAINYRGRPDVITFLQQATVNSETAIIEFGLGNENRPWALEHIGQKIRRNAWHVCAWRRDLAIQSAFPAINYGEDWAYAAPLCAIAKSSAHIDKILHFYRHDAATTEAPPGKV